MAGGVTDAWQPYSIIPPSTKRKLSQINPIHNKTHPKDDTYVSALGLNPAVVAERVAGKFLQLESAEGRVSDWRKKELKVREEENEKKKRRKVRDGECGLVGRRKKRREATRVEKEGGEKKETNVRYDAIAPLHQMWLGYIAELLGLPVPATPITPPSPATSNEPIASTSTLLPSFPPKIPDTSSTIPKDFRINVQTIQTKLLKAELVGSVISVKRAKNPSLVNLSGIVLQETQGTFKIVTPASRVKVIPKKHSVFTFSIPLAVPVPESETSRELSFDIFGDAFCYRAADRINKKWKAGGGSGGVELV